MKKIVSIGSGVLLVFGSLVGVVNVSLAAGLASAGPICSNAATATPFLTVTQPITEPDSATSGANWATDTFTEQAIVWLGTDGTTFCASGNITSGGTFTTTGPTSPQNGTYLPAGITGTITGGETWILPSGTATTTSNSSVVLSADTSSSTGQFNDWQSQVLTRTAGASTYYFNYIVNGQPGNSWTNADPTSNTGGNSGDIYPVYDATTNIGYPTIQAAVNAANSGDTITVAAGTYSGGINIPVGLTLEGPNADINPNVTSTSRVAEAVIASGDPAFMINATSPVTVSGFTFDGTGAPIKSGVAGTAPTLTDNIMENTTGGDGGLFFQDASTLALENNEFFNLDPNANDGVRIIGSDNGSVGTDVTISGNVWKNSPEQTGINATNIQGTVSGNTFDGVADYALLISNNSANLTISSNTFENIVTTDQGVSTWGAGIRFYEADV